jgi:hypothetical protein
VTQSLIVAEAYAVFRSACASCAASEIRVDFSVPVVSRLTLVPCRAHRLLIGQKMAATLTPVRRVACD